MLWWKDGNKYIVELNAALSWNIQPKTWKLIGEQSYTIQQNYVSI